MTASDEICKLLEEDEGQTLEFKDSQILSDRFKIAKVLTAFANAEGGTLLIGVKDDKTIEGMKAKKEHEEHIMNIASDKCDPRLSPKFEKVGVPKKGDVYLIRVPERRGPYHAVRVKKGGYKFFIRVGSTIREMPSSELSIGEQGVEIPIEHGFENFFSWLGKMVLRKFYGRLDIKIFKFKMTLLVLGSLLAGVPIFLMFRIQEGKLTIVTYSSLEYVLLAVSLVISIMLFNWFSYTSRTKCPKCNSYFSFHTMRKWIFEKRTIREGLEEWKTRRLKRCNECSYEVLGKLKYEKVPIE